DGRPHDGEKLRRVALSLHDDVKAAEGELAIGEVNGRLGIADERLIPDVRDDAHDLEPRAGAHEVLAHRADILHADHDSLADWILRGPVTARQRFVDEYHRRRGRV